MLVIKHYSWSLADYILLLNVSKFQKWARKMHLFLSYLKASRHLPYKQTVFIYLFYLYNSKRPSLFYNIVKIFRCWLLLHLFALEYNYILRKKYYQFCIVIVIPLLILMRAENKWLHFQPSATYATHIICTMAST